MAEDISPPPSKRRRTDVLASEGDVGDVTRKIRHVTIYSWNVNGIAPFVQQSITSFFSTNTHENAQPHSTDSPPRASLRDFLRRHEWPTMLFLQEVKINPDDAATIRAVQKGVKPQRGDPPGSPEYVTEFCLPSDKYNARGFGRKVYGVCSVVRKDFFDMTGAKFKTVDWDVEGRFLILETKAATGVPKLAIINVYAVNGTDNPYNDPSTGKVAGTRHDRKLQVHQKLQEQCEKLQSHGYGVIIAGDINIARSVMDEYPNLRTFPQQHCKNRADFEARFFGPTTTLPKEGGSVSASDSGDESVQGLGMVDTFRHLHPTKRGYTYYPRGRGWGDSCDRVDMIITSKSLENNIASSGMLETPGERGPSDHVPLWSSLNFDLAIG